MTNQPDSNSDLGDRLNLILVLSRSNLMLHVGTPQDIIDHFELSEPAVDQVHDDESADLQFYSSTARRLSVGDLFAAARGDASRGPTGKRPPDDEDASRVARTHRRQPDEGAALLGRIPTLEATA